MLDLASFIYFWCVFLCSKQYHTTLYYSYPNNANHIVHLLYLINLATVLHKSFFVSYKGQWFNYNSI